MRGLLGSRLVERIVTVAAACAIALVVALVAGRLTGHVLLIDRSDSMQPAIAAGDLLLTRTTPANRVRAGDVVTFADPARSGRTITHRVVSVRALRGRLAFETRGDANRSGERWTIARSGTVGRTLAVIHRAGYGMDWLSRPWTRFALLAGAGVALGGMLLRRIWAA